MSKYWEERVQKTWNRQAKAWDERSVKMWDEGSRKDLIPRLQKYLPARKRVIDIGCGSGYGTYKLYQAGYQAIGVDLSDQMVELAKSHFPKEEVTFYKADLSELPKWKESYDGALVVNVFEWTKDPLTALKNLEKILNNQGYLCITIFGPTAGPRQNSFPRLLGEEVIFNTVMPWEFEQMLKETSFTLVDEYGVYKKGVTEAINKKLSKELKQALSFMWVYILQKDKDGSHATE